MEKNLKKTPLNAWHKEHGGQMVEFAGWEMPVAYKRGIIDEHLSTRKFGGLFDISHMGRFLVCGKDTIPFLQHVLNGSPLLEDFEQLHHDMCYMMRSMGYPIRHWLSLHLVP